MKLSIEKGELTLQEGASFELAFNHPFFTDGEEQAFSFTLPATDRNLALLGFPDRLTRRTRFKTDFQAFLEHGLFQFAAKLIVDNYDSKEGITCTLSLDGSALYRDFQDKNIKDLLIEPGISGIDTDGKPMRPFRPSASTILSMYTSLEARGFRGITAFPVTAKVGDFDIIINEPTTDDEGNVSWKNTSARTYTAESDYYEVPANYAIMPFFKLWRLLDAVFSACGYTVEYNVFREKSPYDTLTVIPACVDSLCAFDTVPRQDMAPSMTVGELITWLRDKFAAIVLCRGKFLQIRFMADMIAADPDLDLTQYAIDGRGIAYPLSKRVILSVDTSIDGATPPAETLQKFYSTAAQYPEVGPDYDVSQNPGCYYKPGLGQFLANKGGTVETVGSDVFKYDRENSEETEDHSATDLFVPMKIVTMNGKTAVLPFIGDAAHFHTNINGDTGVTESPLMLCWDIWDQGKHYGSSYPYSLADLGFIDELPEIFPLTPEGLYGPNWKAYNELILNSAPEVSLDLDLKEVQLNTFDLASPKLLDGVKMICKSLTIEVDGEGASVAHGVFIPIIDYDDMVVDQPIVPNLQLEWELVDTFDENLPGVSEIFVPITGTVIRLSKQQRLDAIEKIDDWNVVRYETDGLEDYTMDNAPLEGPVALYQEILSRERTISFLIQKNHTLVFRERIFTYREYFRAKVKD